MIVSSIEKEKLGEKIIYLNEKINSEEEIIIAPDTILVVTIFENYEQYNERKEEC